jgi:hypothetical protein
VGKARILAGVALRHSCGSTRVRWEGEVRHTGFETGGDRGRELTAVRPWRRRRLKFLWRKWLGRPEDGVERLGGEVEGG